MFTEKEGVFLIAAESTTVKQFGIGVACGKWFSEKSKCLFVLLCMEQEGKHVKNALFTTFHR